MNNLLIILLIVFLHTTSESQIKTQKQGENSMIGFVEMSSELPTPDKNLRKWDAPIIADLDQDGYDDLLLNDHGLGVSVAWNDKGKFNKPYDIIMGDLHGISVGDFNQDGDLDIIISRGGGSGSNARNSKIFTVSKEREIIPMDNFDVPLELMRGRTVKFLDGDNDGDLDLLNFAFPDKVKKGISENYIYENNGSGQLILASSLPPASGDGQKTCLTDFNNDHIIDLLLFGNGPLKAYLGNGDLTYKDVSAEILSSDITDVTSIVEIDFDNDGDFDLYLTRGKDFDAGQTFYDQEQKIWGFMSKRGKSNFQDLHIGDVIQLVNFQSQWPHNDAYFIGETGYEYQFPGETHSGKKMRIVNSDALGFPDDISNKEGIHLGYIGNEKWRLVIDTWSPTTGIIMGVKDYHVETVEEQLQDILLENIDGRFFDSNKSRTVDVPEYTTCAVSADVDNDGFQDIIAIKRGDLIHPNKAIILKNVDGKKFIRIEDHSIVSQELGAIGMGVETVDYNMDGQVDVVVGNERGKWHLFKNVSEKANNFVSLHIGTSPAGNCSALGAVVELNVCGKKIKKRIGSTGAAYSQGFKNLEHFGLGACEGPIDASIRYTNGEIVHKTLTEINTIQNQ